MKDPHFLSQTFSITILDGIISQSLQVLVQKIGVGPQGDLDSRLKSFFSSSLMQNKLRCLLTVIKDLQVSLL